VAIDIYRLMNSNNNSTILINIMMIMIYLFKYNYNIKMDDGSDFFCTSNALE